MQDKHAEHAHSGNLNALFWTWYHNW